MNHQQSAPSIKAVLAFFAAGTLLLAWMWWQSHASAHPRRYNYHPAELEAGTVP